MRKQILTTTLAALAVVGLGARPALARFSPHLVSVQAGGGVTDFRAGDYRSNTDIGGAWDVGVTVGTRSPLGLELGYVGTAHGVVDPVGTPTIASNAFEALARINLSTWRVQPFIVGGVGFINFHTFNNDVVSQNMFTRNVDGLVLPVGGGLAAYIGEHGLIDARFTYRFVPQSTLSNDLAAGTNARPDDWMVMARGGYAF